MVALRPNGKVRQALLNRGVGVADGHAHVPLRGRRVAAAALIGQVAGDGAWRQGVYPAACVIVVGTGASSGSCGQQGGGRECSREAHIVRCRILGKRSEPNKLHSRMIAQVEAQGWR